MEKKGKVQAYTLDITSKCLMHPNCEGFEELKTITVSIVFFFVIL